MSGSPNETHRLGLEISQVLPVPGIVLLHGPLGSGKTTLARGIAVGLGVKSGNQVNSPSYTLVNIYEGRCPIYHVDLYRLSGERDIRSVGLEEFMGLEGVTIIEWSERLKNIGFPVVQVYLEDAGESRRKIRISRRGENGRSNAKRRLQEL